MKFALFVLNVFVIFLASPPLTKTQYLPWEQVCHSIDDPHMTSFDGRQFEFHQPGRFNLYNDFDKIKVDAEYLRCSQWETGTCNCGIHIIYKGQYDFFINTCRVSPRNLRFYRRFGSSCIEIDCSAKRVPAGSQTNDAWWSTPGNAVRVGNEFLCATSQYENSVVFVRTNDPETRANIYVQFNLARDNTYAFGISGCHIKPAPKYKYRNGGICGLWDGDQSNDNQYVTYNRRKRDIVITNVTTDAVPQEQSPCPCDPEGTTKCSKSLAMCIAELTKSDVKYKDVISMRKNVANPKSEDEAKVICDKYINRKTYQKAVEDGHIDSPVLDTAYANCILDLQLTGDILFPIIQNERVRASILANIVDLENNPPPYINDLTDPIEKRIPDFREIYEAGSYEYEPPAGCPQQP